MDIEEQEKSNISAKKLESNRRNALKSTGPKTPAGKRNSSRNALKHGLLSKDAVIPIGEGQEDPAEFQELLSDLRQDFQPRGRAEEVLVEIIAVCDWRYRRSLRAEVAEVVNGFSEEQALHLPGVSPHMSLLGVNTTSTILRYQTAVYRQKTQAMQLLENLQRRRKTIAASMAENRSSGEE